MSSKSRKIVSEETFKIILKRMAHSLLEHHSFSEDSIIVGLQPRGVHLANYLVKELKAINKKKVVQHAVIDHTFFRDDFREQDQILTPNSTRFNFDLEGKNIVLIDDVLYTGRSVRSGIEALMSLGRPKSIELMVLIDRRFHRELPIEPNYTGLKVDVLGAEKVELKWLKDNSIAEVYITR